MSKSSAVPQNEREEWPDHSWTMLDAALFYADKDWPIFPVRMPQKTPMIDGGFHAATTNTKQIKKWWTKWQNAGIALACGKASGIAVIDLDVKGGVPGRKNAKVLREEHGSFLSSLWSRTPSKGIHRFFNHSELPFPSSAGKIAEGIDLRSSDLDGNGGGYVI